MKKSTSSMKATSRPAVKDGMLVSWFVHFTEKTEEYLL